MSSSRHDVFSDMAYKSNLSDRKKGRINRFPIRREDIVKAYKLMDGDCHYCGCALIGVKTKVNRRSTPDAITIERIANDLPHAADNITVACQRCNVTRGSSIPYNVMRDWGCMIKKGRVKWCKRCNDVCSITKFGRRFDRPEGNYQSLCRVHDREKSAARRERIKKKRNEVL